MTYSDIKAVLFDKDGTLLDTEALFEKALFKTGEDLDLPIDAAFAHGLVGGTRADTVRVLRERFGDAVNGDEVLVRIGQNFYDLLETLGLPLIDGAIETLEHVRAKGYAMALVTNAARAETLDHLGELGLLDYFDIVVASDDVAYPKPAPDPYLRASELLKISPENCLVIEDSETGLRSGLAAGMRCVLVGDRPVFDGQDVQGIQQIAKISDLQEHL